MAIERSLDTPAPSTPATPIPRHALKVGALGGMASYLDGGALVTGGIATSLLMAPLQLTPWDLGILSGILTAGLAVGALVGGRLGDKYGRKRVFSIDLLLLAFGLLINATALNEPMLYLGMVITGLAMGADLPVSIALVAEEAPPEHRGKLVGMSQLFWGLGPIATLLLNALMGNLGVEPELMARLLWAHLGIVALVVWFLRRRLPESRQWLQASAEAARKDDPALVDQLGQAGSIDPRQLRSLALYSAPLLATGIFYTVGNLAPNTGGQFGFYIVTQIVGFTPQAAGNMFMLIAPLGITMSLIFMRVVDTPWRRPAMIAGGVLQVVAYLVPVVVGFTPAAYLFAFYASLAGNAFIGEALYKVRTQELFPVLVRGTAQGLTIFICRMFTALFALVTPALAHASPTALMAVLAGLNLVTLGLGLWVVRMQPAADPALAKAA
jgi:inositol transporter-like SP family MFS transporter